VAKEYQQGTGIAARASLIDLVRLGNSVVIRRRSTTVLPFRGIEIHSLIDLEAILEFRDCLSSEVCSDYACRFVQGLRDRRAEWNVNPLST
jgi:hypothetical protein